MDRLPRCCRNSQLHHYRSLSGRPSADSIGVSSFDYQERQGARPTMDYVQGINTRFSNVPDTYKQFLEILASRKSSADNVRFATMFFFRR